MVGHAKDKILYSKAKGINKSVVYVGSKTGEMEFMGASMASAEFDAKILKIKNLLFR